MMYFVPYLSAVLLFAVGCTGSGIDCTSCENVAAHDAEGNMRCHCDVTLDIPGAKKTGRFDITTQECTASLFVSGEFDGHSVPKTNVTSDGIHLERSPLCEDHNITIQFHDVFFSEAGAHFCPRLDICSDLTLQNDEKWCVTVHTNDSCLQHRYCSACMDHEGPNGVLGGCAWCAETNACLRAHPTSGADHCGVCPAALSVKQAALCPLKNVKLPDDRACDAWKDSDKCRSGFCKWESQEHTCAALSQRELPDLATRYIPKVDFGRDDVDSWGKNMKLTLPPISFPNNPIGNSDDATKDPQHSTGVDSRTTEEATVNRKFVEHKPEERERVEMWAALVTVCFCCAFGLMGVMLRRLYVMKRMQASTLPEFGVIGSCDSSERGDLESISDSRCGLTDGYVDPVGTQWQDKQENDNNVGMNEVEY